MFCRSSTKEEFFPNTIQRRWTTCWFIFLFWHTQKKTFYRRRCSSLKCSVIHPFFSWRQTLRSNCWCQQISAELDSIWKSYWGKTIVSLESDYFFLDFQFIRQKFYPVQYVHTPANMVTYWWLKPKQSSNYSSFDPSTSGLLQHISLTDKSCLT